MHTHTPTGHFSNCFLRISNSFLVYARTNAILGNKDPVSLRRCEDAGRQPPCNTCLPFWNNPSPQMPPAMLIPSAQNIKNLLNFRWSTLCRSSACRRRWHTTRSRMQWGHTSRCFPHTPRSFLLHLVSEKITLPYNLSANYEDPTSETWADTFVIRWHWKGHMMLQECWFCSENPEQTQIWKAISSWIWSV